jgi:hypothetical protein
MRPELRDTRSVSETFEPGLRKPVESPNRAADILCVSAPQSTRLQTLARVCLAVFCLVSFGASLCRAQGTYTAKTCSQSDVSAVINGPTHTAVNGDTIIIPPGSCTWTTGVTVSGVGIDITGTGTPNTGGGTVGAGTTNTTLIDNASGPLFTFTGLTTSSATAKVEILTMSASGASAGSIPEAILLTGTCTTSSPYCASIRVDNIVFTAGTWESVLTYSFITTDDVFGVIDHTTENEASSAGAPPLVTVNYGSWEGVGEYGDNSMASADTFGSAQELYIENNSLSGIRGTDVPGGSGASSYAEQGGARYVCRFNAFTNMSQSGICPNHGTAWSGRPRGVRQVEVYYNTVSAGSYSCLALTNLLGGTGRFFSNTVTSNCQEFLSMDIARFEKVSTPWNACDGTQPWDQAPFSSSSQCLDQPGTGAGQLYSTANPATLESLVDTVCSTLGQCFPNPASDPVYEAGDTAPGSVAPVEINSSGAQTRVLANRDYYGEVSQSAQTSPTSPFNGTSGTGYGTLANRPTTCTAGVGYWATDTGTWNTLNSKQGTLYTCNSGGNAWTASFTPYTYPHPLVAGGSTGSGGNPPNSPTALTATVN